MSSDYTQYLAKAEHFDFDQTVTTVLAVFVAVFCLQDSLLKLLNTAVLCCFCGNEDYTCSSKLWKLLLSITQFILGMTILYTLYEFNFDSNHIDNSITRSNSGYDFDFVCFNTNIVDYVNSIDFMTLRYENLLLIWIISVLCNLNYFFEGSLQCSIDNASISIEKQNKKASTLGIFGVLYLVIQIIVAAFMFPVFCDNKNNLKYVFILDAIMTFAVLVIYFSMVPRVSHFDCQACCEVCYCDSDKSASCCGLRSFLVTLFNLGLIFYSYLVTVEFDTMVGILLWLSSLCVRVLLYYLSSEHEITQWCRQCCVSHEFQKQNKHNNDGLGSMGTGIELTMPKRSTGGWQPPQLPAEKAQPLSSFDSTTQGRDKAPLTIPNYDDL